MGVGRVIMTQQSNMQLMREYIDDCEIRALSPETIRSKKSNIRTIARYLDKEGLEFKEVNKETLKKILLYLRNTREVSFTTQKHYFSDLSSFYEYLVYEEKTKANPVPPFRKRYLNGYKKKRTPAKRKLISIEDMGMLINATLAIRDKALMTVLAKTGVRRGELISMDMVDIDFDLGRIKIKSKKKRSNPFVYFDEECFVVLSRWLRVRDQMADPGEVALFVGDLGARIGRNMVYKIVTDQAEIVGLHDSDSPRLEDHFSPHCFRHWFTTHLRRGGLKREFIQELRGDSRREAVDIYDHIDHGELRKEYIAAIPRLGII
jgi:integrase/recombinase XerD